MKETMIIISLIVLMVVSYFIEDKNKEMINNQDEIIESQERQIEILRELTFGYVEEINTLEELIEVQKELLKANDVLILRLENKIEKLMDEKKQLIRKLLEVSK